MSKTRPTFTAEDYDRQADAEEARHGRTMLWAELRQAAAQAERERHALIAVDAIEHVNSLSNDGDLDQRVMRIGKLVSEQAEQIAAMQKEFDSEVDTRIELQCEVKNLRHSTDHAWVIRAQAGERTLAAVRAHIDTALATMAPESTLANYDALVQAGSESAFIQVRKILDGATEPKR